MVTLTKTTTMTILILILLVEFRLGQTIPSTCSVNDNLKYKLADYKSYGNADERLQKFINKSKNYGYLYENTVFYPNKDFRVYGKLFTSGTSIVTDGFAILISKSIQINENAGGGNLGYKDLTQLVAFEFDMFRNDDLDSSETSISIHECLSPNTKCSTKENKDTQDTTISTSRITDFNLAFDLSYDSKTQTINYRIENLNNNWPKNLYTLSKVLPDFNTQFKDGFYLGMSVGFMRTIIYNIDYIHYCSTCFDDQIQVNGRCVCKDNGKLLNPSSLKCEFCSVGTFAENNICVASCSIKNNYINQETKSCGLCSSLIDGKFCVKSCITPGTVPINGICQAKPQEKKNIQGKIYVSDMNCGVTKRDISFSSVKFSKENFNIGEIIDVTLLGRVEISTVLNSLRISVETMQDIILINENNSGSFSNSSKEFKFQLNTESFEQNKEYTVVARHFNTNMMISSCIKLVLTTKSDDIKQNPTQIYNFSCPNGTLPTLFTFLKELTKPVTSTMTMLSSTQLSSNSRRIFKNPHDFTLEDDLTLITNVNVVNRQNPSALSAIDQLAISFVDKDVNIRDKDFRGVKLLVKLLDSDKLSSDNISFSECYGEACYATNGSGVLDKNVSYIYI